MKFDIPSRGVATTYAVFVESRGKRALLEGSSIAPNVAHVKSQVPPVRLHTVATQQLSLNFPVTVSVVTDLGNASASLTLE
jgi:hypothetical protein